MSAPFSDRQAIVQAFDAIDARVIDYDWPFVRARAEDIASCWDSLKARSPDVFDGRVLLLRDWSVDGERDARILRSTHFETNYSAFMAWRDLGFPDPGVRNCFAMAALQSSDGAYALGVMGPRTANAGQVYFAAGTPDPSDVRGDRLDLEGSVLRELFEETGLTDADIVVSPGWSVIELGPRLACMKRVRTRLDAASLRARIRDELARQATPELEDVVLVRAIDDLDAQRMPAFMLAWLRWALANDAGGQLAG